MDYDVIVVGGGAAGLTAAAYSARAGKSVALFERQPVLGGLTQSVNRNGFAFDIGLRAIENSGIVLPMAEDLGLPLEYVKSPVSVGIAEHVVRIDSRESLDDYRRLLESFYPKSSADISKIMDVIHRIMKDMDVLYGIDNPLFRDLMSDYRFVFRTLLPWSIRFLVTIGRINRMNTPVEEFLATLTADESLRSIIGQHFFRYTPAFFAMSYFSVYLDYLYPKGGTGKLMELLADYCRTNGVALHRSTGITAVDPDAHMVTCDDGAPHRYRTLVWAGDLNGLYGAVDTTRINHSRSREAVERRRDELKQHTGGDSVFSIFLSVDQPPEYFSTRSEGHFFYTPSPRGLGELHTRGLERLMTGLAAGTASRADVTSYLSEFLELNTFEISIPVLKDASLAPPGKTGVIVSFLLDYGFTRRIRQDGWYEEFKEYCMDEVVRVLSTSVYPKLAGAVSDRFASTPLSIERHTGNTGGGITGWALGPGEVPVVHKMQQVSRSVLTPMRDVFQAGQWVYSPSGLPIAILTGKLAANRAVRG